MIDINKEVAADLGKSISSVHLKEVKKDTFKDPEYEMLVLFIQTAISHQINWDFQESRLRSIPKERFTPYHLKDITSEQLNDLLKDYNKPENINPKERAYFIRDLCKLLSEKYGGKIKVLLEKSDFSVIKLKENLEESVAFSEDPLRKKSNILIQMLSRKGLVRFEDIEKVDPAIDYHLIRLALRTGSIEINDPFLQRKIMAVEPITTEEDTNIRRAVSESFRITARQGNKSIVDLNMIEWHIARSFCKRNDPLCTINSNPLAEELEFNFRNKCPLSDFCRKNMQYKREPNFKTSYY